MKYTSPSHSFSFSMLSSLCKELPKCFQNKCSIGNLFPKGLKIITAQKLINVNCMMHATKVLVDAYIPSRNMCAHHQYLSPEIWG